MCFYIVHYIIVKLNVFNCLKVELLKQNLQIILLKHLFMSHYLNTYEKELCSFSTTKSVGRGGGMVVV